MGNAIWGMILTVGLGLGAAAQAQTEFTIGTGAATLTYAPIGDLIAPQVAAALGVPVRTVPSRGSLDNITAIADGTLVTGFAQSDIAYWAYDGSGIWSGNPAVEELRTIAALYEEHIHVVTLADSGIESIDGLRNKRISLDEVGSGTHVDARLILEAAGLRSDEFAVATLSGMDAADALVAGTIDAFFAVAGYPVNVIADLAQRAEIRLIPVDGDISVELLYRHGFLSQSSIPEGVYPGVAGVDTVSVGAHWFTHADVPEEVIFAATQALFSEENLRLLADGHPVGGRISAATSLDGVGVPLHPGAVRFYEESGVMD